MKDRTKPRTLTVEELKLVIGGAEIIIDEPDPIGITEEPDPI